MVSSHGLEGKVGEPEELGGAVSADRSAGAAAAAESSVGEGSPGEDLMVGVGQRLGEWDDDPDVAFNMTPDPAPAAEVAQHRDRVADDRATPDVAPTVAAEVEQCGRELIRQVARDLAAVGPAGWRQLEAVFALTAVSEVAHVYFSNGDRSVRVEPSQAVLARVREQRDIAARLSAGPWWRLMLQLSADGELEVDYDYGDEPFPDDQLFAPAAYRADLEEYPRGRLPVWLAAYVGHEGRQSRTPQQAAAKVRADRAEEMWALPFEGDFPPFPTMWARWATIAAAFVAVGSPWGPRILPSLGWFEGAKRGGSTIYALPGGRAVLSGGHWDALALDATYNDGEPMPDFYVGAPHWVANPVLNPRAANGLLSFCYWWEGGRWYRGESPPAHELSDAVPGMWTANTVIQVVAGLIAEQPSDQERDAVAALVAAAEAGVVTRDTLLEVFDEEEGFDIDGAMYQLSIAGVAAAVLDRIPPEEAIARVRQYILDRGIDTTGHFLSELTALRITDGWMVCVPTEQGENTIGRAIVYITDDGVLEQSSSSIAPSTYAADFEQRLQQRHRRL